MSFPEGTYAIYSDFAKSYVSYDRTSEITAVFTDYQETNEPAVFQIKSLGGKKYSIQSFNSYNDYLGVASNRDAVEVQSDVQAWDFSDFGVSWVITTGGDHDRRSWTARARGNEPFEEVSVLEWVNSKEQHWQIVDPAVLTAPQKNPLVFPPTGRYKVASKDVLAYLSTSDPAGPTVSDIFTEQRGFSGETFLLQRVDHFGHYLIRAPRRDTTYIGIGSEGQLKNVSTSPTVWTLVPQLTPLNPTAYAICKVSDKIVPIQEDDGNYGAFTNPNDLFWSTEPKGKKITAKSVPYTLVNDVPVLDERALFVIAPQA